MWAGSSSMSGTRPGPGAEEVVLSDGAGAGSFALAGVPGWEGTAPNPGNVAAGVPGADRGRSGACLAPGRAE